MSIVIAIAVFGLLIFIHELGHFTVAKMSGIVVHSFSIGFGPALIKKEMGGTVYAIRLLPFGGAVTMKGEIDEEGEPDTVGSFQSATVWQRMAVSLAGSGMNFILGIVILLIISIPIKQIPTSVVTDLAPTFEYVGENGFEVGDEIVKVNDFNVFIYNDLMMGLEMGKGAAYDFTVIRDGEKVKLNDVPLEKKVADKDPTKPPLYGFTFDRKSATFIDKIKFAGENVASFVQSVVISIKYMFTGMVQADDIMGTVGITTEIGARAKSSMADMWYFVAFLSVNLSLVNLLPIPGLDGGKMVFLIIEAIRRKPINQKYEAYIQAAGLVFLLGLFVFVTYNDIAKLIGG